MLRIILVRALLVALPFAVWFAWAALARRSGRPMGSTPWAWLFTAGAVMVGLSFVALAVIHPDNRHERYVPGEMMPSGAVTRGHFEPAEGTPP